MTPEGKVKERVKRVLDKYRPELWAHWPVQMGYGAPTLDCTGALNGHAFAIETKYNDVPTPRQRLTIDEMRAAGITVFVVGETIYAGDAGQWEASGMEDLKTWLRSHK